MATLADLQSYAAQVAQQWGIPTSIFNWQINQESGFNPNAQNGNATGIAQFMPGTASQFGINPNDPYASLNAAAQYDAQLYQQTGSWTGALTKYGTLANVPASVTNSWNSLLGNLGMSANTTSGNGTGTSAGTTATSDPFIMKVAMIILGIVLIGGAIVVYGRSKV